MNLLRWDDYKQYHIDMVSIGDCDPAYPALEYVANRFELNIEQRYWLAYLYSTCYCVATVFYIYNEFPDYENVDVDRLERWWNKNKSKCLFQTDRLKVKSFDKFIPMFKSYRAFVGDNQEATFKKLLEEDPIKSYNNLYDFCIQFYYMGRFTLFLYLECMKFLTNIPIEIDNLDLREAESCRNGLCYAIGLDEMVTKKGKNIKLSNYDYQILFEYLHQVVSELKNEHPEENVTYWSVETSLCSYKKMYWKKRYLGYYIDRMMVEINKMQENVKEGVDWSVLWDFRREYFCRDWLGELNNWNNIRKNLFGIYKINQIYDSISK
jgi:hypothetical protein